VQSEASAADLEDAPGSRCDRLPPGAGRASPRHRAARTGEVGFRDQPQLQGEDGLTGRRVLPREPRGGGASARRVSSPRRRDGRRTATRRWTELAAPAPAAERVPSSRVPERLSGAWRSSPRTTSTPRIYGKDYTYRELAREEMAGRDGELRPCVRRRARAATSWSAAELRHRFLARAGVTALQARDPLVIAGSFSQTTCGTPSTTGSSASRRRRSCAAQELFAREIAAGERTIIRRGDRDRLHHRHAPLPRRGLHFRRLEACRSRWSSRAVSRTSYVAPGAR